MSAQATPKLSWLYPLHDQCHGQSPADLEVDRALQAAWLIEHLWVLLQPTHRLGDLTRQSAEAGDG